MERILTKFVAPLEPVALLDRPRLRELLPSVGTRRLTMVKAPAGYGKTTLMTQWLDDLKARGEIAVWFALDQCEARASAFMASIVFMLGTEPRLRSGSGDGVRSEALFKIETLVAELVDRLATCSSPVYLFFDDLHSIGTEAVKALAELVRCAPRNAHFVIATRELKGFELAAMRAYGQLLEIGQTDLRFTTIEAGALLAGAGHQKFTTEEVGTIVTKTEGWVTGLKLATFAMTRGTDAKQLLTSFSGRRRAIADYFAEYVFSRQCDDVREFLLATAVLDRLSPALCDVLAERDDSDRMLRHLEEIGLFIVALDEDGNWYRYHSLFSDFLQRKLGETDTRAVFNQHRRAAKVFADQAAHLEALDHAHRSTDHVLLASILEQVSEDFISMGRLRHIVKFAGYLPKEILAKSPWTLAAVAWMRLRGLRFSETRQLLDLASARLRAIKSEGTAHADAIEDLGRTIEHREMMLAAAQDQTVRVEEYGARLLRYFAPRRPYIACTIQAELISARREHFRFEGLDRLHMQCRTSAEESGYRFAEISVLAAAGVSLFAAGRTDAAIAALNRGLEESTHWAGRNSSLSALFALPLADIAYECNDLSLAAEYIEFHLPLARELCFVDQLLAGFLVKSRLCRAHGDLDGARAALDDGRNVALERDLERLRLSVLHEQVRLSLRAASPAAAVREAADALTSTSQEELRPHPQSNTRDELKAMIRVRMLISQAQTAEALAIAKSWRAFCEHRGALRSLVRWQILIAEALMIDGDPRAAQRSMRAAITLAAPARMIRVFVDEGPTVLSILSEAYNDNMVSQLPADRFARIVLDAFGCRRPKLEAVAAAEDGLYGRLTSTELEILTLVGCGMRNREIGDRLGLSEGSVKWYMQQVYDKVGIRRRSQAVERARQFGLIA